MASSDVDQKYIGRIAHFTRKRNPIVSEAFYQILGLSVILSRKLYRARRLRRLDTTRETRSLQLYHHIIWLSKEGLAILEAYILPYTQDGQEGPECQVLAAKLRASFLHIFCIFHNDPPITAASGSASFIPGGDDLTPTAGRHSDYYSGSGYESMTPLKDTTPPKRNSRGRMPALRDPINSVTSDASFLTNPYAGEQPGDSPPQEHSAPMFPPGLNRPSSMPHPSAFILPTRNFVPIARTYFTQASSAAATLLPGAHPLRLSTALEHAAFLWDCVRDHEGSRQLSRYTIRHLKDGEDEDVSDEAFEDAAEMVQILGKLMRRRSFESTPRTGHPDSSDISTGPSSSSQFPPILRPEQARSPPVRETGPLRGEPSQTTPRQTTPRKTPPRPPRPDDKDLLDTPTRLPGSRSRATSSSSTAPPSARPLGAPIEIPTPSRSVREARTRRSSNPAGLEGGPVGGYTPPRRRESTKSTTGHRRGPSVQASPQQLQPLQRTPQNTGSVRRKRSSEDATPPRGHVGFSYNPVTPPRPPPKDAGYTPSTLSTGKSTGSTRRSSTGRRVGFANDSNTGTIVKRPTRTERPSTNGNGIHTNGSGTHTNGYYEDPTSDQRGKGER
jgi:hypothetical protein